MRKIVATILVIAVAMSVMPAFTAVAAEKGASAKAYEQASDEAVFYRVSDWFATRGKTEEEKDAIIAERKAARAAKRAQKEADKQKRKMEQVMKKSQKQTKEQAGQMKKGLKK